MTLSTVYDVPVTVDYATADLTPDEVNSYLTPSATAGVDYMATMGTLTIPAGETSGTITVLVFGDRVGDGYDPYGVQGLEMFSVNLSNPNGAQLNTSQAFGLIADDEPYVNIGGSTAWEGNAGTTPISFTVSLSAVFDVDVTVSYKTADGTALAGSDYQAAVGAVTIPAGQLSQTVTVLVNGDVLDEGDEFFLVNLTDASGLLLETSPATRPSATTIRLPLRSASATPRSSRGTAARN